MTTDSLGNPIDLELAEFNSPETSDDSIAETVLAQLANEPVPLDVGEADEEVEIAGVARDGPDARRLQVRAQPLFLPELGVRTVQVPFHQQAVAATGPVVADRAIAVGIGRPAVEGDLQRRVGFPALGRRDLMRLHRHA